MDENSIALKQFISEGKCLINYLNTMLLIFQRLITETLRKLITRITSRQSLLNVEVKVTPMKQIVSSEFWSERKLQGTNRTPMEIAGGDSM